MNHRKYLSIILTTIILFPIFSFVVSADFKSASDEYTKILKEHNLALSEYKIAKNTFETYNTLSSLTQVLQKSSTYLQKRDELLIAHFNMINSKLDEIEMPGIQKSQLKDIVTSEITFFDNHKSLIQSISTIGDINAISGKVENEIPLANIKSKQILGNMLVAKVKNSLPQYETLSQGIEKQISDLKIRKIKQQSTIDKLERWLVEVKNKKIIAENNLNQNIESLNNLSKEANDINKKFDEIRVNIIQSQLYLKEGTSFMSEILNEIKYE